MCSSGCCGLVEETPADAQWGEPSTAIDATTAMNNAMTVTSRHLIRGLEHLGHTQRGTQSARVPREAIRARERQIGTQSAREAVTCRHCCSHRQWQCGIVARQWHCCSDTGSGIVALGSGTVAVTQAVALWHCAVTLLQCHRVASGSGSGASGSGSGASGSGSGAPVRSARHRRD